MYQTVGSRQQQQQQQWRNACSRHTLMAIRAMKTRDYGLVEDIFASLDVFQCVLNESTDTDG